MKFAEDHNSADYRITSYNDEGIQVNDRLITNSFIMSPNTLDETLSVDTITQLTPSDLEKLFVLKPEVILIGTGKKQVFPEKPIIKALVKHGIGFEIMNNQAACRTYNILISEDRNVATLFIGN